MLFVGAIYKQPDLLVEQGQYIRSKYDFADDVARFFYDHAEIIYQKRTQNINKTSVMSYFSEDPERLSAYKKYGGWKTLEQWIKLSSPDDIQNYVEVLKKFSLLREYQRQGFAVDKIMAHDRFEQFTASDIYRLIRGKADRIHTVILTNQEAEILNSRIKSTLLGCMEKPDLGIPLPFPIMTDMFRGMKLQSIMAVGMLSNAGKSRYMTLLIAYVALVLHKSVLVLLNEMTVQELRFALITTVINNDYFQAVHGIKLRKCEKELALGLYRDNNGELIYQKTDEIGNSLETIEQYVERVTENSEEYTKVMKIAEWIESEASELIFAKDMSDGYDDKTLEFEIRKARLTRNVEYFFYDTFKQDIKDTGDWAAMKATATRLAELTKELNMFGYLSIQLTDDAEMCKPDALTSNNIANCKQIKHVMHTMVLFKEIPREDFHKYGYTPMDDSWGTNVAIPLTEGKRYYIGNTDKNRFGDKVKLVFEIDLDLNTWVEKGKLVRRR